MLTDVAAHTTATHKWKLLGAGPGRLHAGCGSGCERARAGEAVGGRLARCARAQTPQVPVPDSARQGNRTTSSRAENPSALGELEAAQAPAEGQTRAARLPLFRGAPPLLPCTAALADHAHAPPRWERSSSMPASRRRGGRPGDARAVAQQCLPSSLQHAAAMSARAQQQLSLLAGGFAQAGTHGRRRCRLEALTSHPPPTCPPQVWQAAGPDAGACGVHSPAVPAHRPQVGSAGGQSPL